tara:strand:+ start:326 stop:637 length:312 start_codon:yes stop_codon:yes gene_type:complete
MEPIGYRVIIKVENSEFMKKAEVGRIILTEETKDKEKGAQQEAIIIAIGPSAFKGHDFDGTEIKVGDKVLTTRYSGEGREDIEEGYIVKVINDEDVLCKLIED